VVVLENVKGLVEQHRDVFQQALHSLVTSGYSVAWDKLNTKQHGLPQSRPRIYVVAIQGQCVAHRFNFPKPLNVKPPIASVLEWRPSKPGRFRFTLTGKRNMEKAEKILAKKLPGVDIATIPVLVDLQASRTFACHAHNGSPCVTASRAKTGGSTSPTSGG
jgi:site-specific DNA-cytosine methylase